MRTIAEAFNEWMKRYVEDPDGFEREWMTVGKFLAEQNGGQIPSYGQIAAATLQGFIDGK